MRTNVDLVVGEHRLARKPVTGRIEVIREFDGLEIGRFVPYDPRDDDSCWRILLPANPIPCAFVDLNPGRTGQWIRCFERVHPPRPERGFEKGFTASAISVAGCNLYRWGLDALLSGKAPPNVDLAVQWADGTRFETKYQPLWRKVEYEGTRFWREVHDLSSALFLRFREEAGLAPTPPRFFQDGLVAPEIARERYLDEVTSRPDLRTRALHILGRCVL